MQYLVSKDKYRNFKIVILTTGLNYGGAETQVFHLAKHLKLRGWDVYVVSILPPKAYVEELESMKIQVLTLNLKSKIHFFSPIIKLTNIIYRIRPDILHAHMVHANILARLVRSFVRVPVLICTAHSIVEGGRIREWGYRLTDFLCDLTTQVSQDGLDRYLRVKAVPQNKIRVVHNGVDINRFCKNVEARKRLRREFNIKDDFVWLAVGRLEKEKDYPNLLKAFSKVLRVYENVILLIVGQGVLEKDIKNLSRLLNIEDKVIFLGIRRDIPDIMNAADAYVMSSAWEGFPMVLLEAASIGLPIIATNVGGNKEIVINGKNGFLVPARDSDELAKAMLKMMSLSFDNRIRMGEWGRKYVEENYSIENIVDKWESIYFEFLNKKIKNLKVDYENSSYSR
jgi:glycosyltransferase involved in cell wall biosynthesis